MENNQVSKEQAELILAELEMNITQAWAKHKFLSKQLEALENEAGKLERDHKKVAAAIASAEQPVIEAEPVQD